jgi:glycosyltransferase involved in cell wall biosynthesis
MATLGRSEVIHGLMQSLVQQTYKNFELIVVDQNEDDRVETIIKEYLDKLNIVYLKSSKGLSLARNVALRHISGEIVGFPDDDCVYETTLLEKVVGKFQSENVHGIIGRMVDEFHQWDKRVEKKINIYNVWRKNSSITIFLQKAVIERVGDFDEKLGVGSGTVYGSGEETDYLIRSLKEGFHIYYDSDLQIKHPKEDLTDPKNSRKAYYYSLGRMYVLKKHHYNRLFIMVNILYPLFKLIINLDNKNKVKYFWQQFLGRIQKM